MTKKTISIGNDKIGEGQPPYIIAEMSGNHNQSLDRALAIVEAAAEAGAQALKLQTYTADTMTLDISEGEFLIKDEDNLWKGESLYGLYQKAHTPWEWHKTIFEKCREHGITVFSTPFDFSAVDFLEELGVAAYKIASFENTDLSLIQYVARTGKPLIMSTGMATIAELGEAVQTAREAGCADIILLKCTSSYPSTPEDSNLLTIPHMKQLFDVQVGLSDHTLGIGVAIGAAALGATVIEKHFTLNRSEGGVDSAFSLEPAELKALVTESERAWQALGHIQYGPSEKERQSLKFRRSIYIVEDVKKGEHLSEKNLRCIRPGLGLPPKYYDMLLGKTVNCDLKKGTPMSWDLIG
jgi:pseudaminic acid synthase